MVEERVDRARKMVCREFALVLIGGFVNPQTTAEITSLSTLCTASPSFSSTLMGHTSPLCVCSTNAS